MLFYSEMESNVLLMQFPFPPGMEGDSKMVFCNLTHFLYYFAKIVSEEVLLNGNSVNKQGSR